MSVNDIILKDDLKDKYILLSASIPSVDRNDKYYINTNPLDTTDAIVALTRGILSRKGKIIFGGHPTITPLILSVAKEFIYDYQKDDFPLIYIFQSHIFEENISKFTKELLELNIGVIQWTKVRKDLIESLKYMRKQMIKFIPLNAAIFIGGMEGVEEEYSLITKLYPNVPIYPIATTGGAAKKIFSEDIINQEKWKFLWEYDDQNLISHLKNSKEYPFLIKQILLDIKNKPVRILFMFREQLEYDYDNIQQKIKSLNPKEDYEILFDEELWSRSYKVPEAELNKRETEMIRKADIIVKLSQSGSKSRGSRNEGTQREIKMAIKSNKPIIEIYRGSKALISRPNQEISYKYRILIPLERGEPLEKGIYRALKELKKIKKNEFYLTKKEFSMT
ncbi:MAG: hypothetical protein P8Y70_13055 [Candidatus Lokiarchaeota archaeon]